MTTRLYAIPLALATLALAALGAAVFAENVDPFNDNSQYAWSENAGWLNAEPANCGDCGVHVTNTGLSGYMWGENLGWINLSCQNNNTCAAPAGNWGVTNNGAGALSGYAWAENAGWISFSCQNNPSTCAGTGNYGIAINPTTGIFSGYAWGENIGWISFSDTAPVAYQVQTSDSDADGVFAGSDNCPAVSNTGQANADGDAFGDICDACPATADPAACSDDDNDGFSDDVESGMPLCTSTGDDDGDGTANDGCPGGPAQVGPFSEAEFNIGTGPLDSCGLDGWPLDFVSGGIFVSTNRVKIDDLNSFLVPRRLDTNPGNPNFDSRWDLSPGRGVFTDWLNIADINTLLAGTTAFPPMLGSTRAFDGPSCPYPP